MIGADPTTLSAAFKVAETKKFQGRSPTAKKMTKGCPWLWGLKIIENTKASVASLSERVDKEPSVAEQRLLRLVL